MTSSSQTQPVVLKGAQEINSIWVLTLFRIRGVVYQAHMSFFLVFVWLAYDLYSQGIAPLENVQQLVAIIAIFALYELVRALIATNNGLKLDQVTLYPFASVSAVNRQQLPNLIENFSKSAKSNTRQTKTAAHIERIVRMECLPAFLLLLLATLLHEFGLIDQHPALKLAFWTCLVIASSALLPATPFPGACLFATLNKHWWRHGVRLSATPIKLLLLIALVALTIQIETVTFTIAAIAYASVIVEQHMYEKTRLIAARTDVLSAMIPAERLVTLQHGQTVEQALNLVAHTFQPVFPVLHAQQLVGFIERNHLVRILGRLDDGALIDITDRDFAALGPTANLGDALGIIQNSGKDYIAICKDPLAKDLMGLLTKDRLLESLLIKSASSSDPWPDDDAGE